MRRNVEAARDGGEVQSLADEVSQGDDQGVGAHRPSGDEVARGLFGQAHLVFRPQQDDVGQGRFNRIADAAGAVRAFVSGGVVVAGAAAPDVAHVARIDAQIAGEGSAQHLIGGDQGAQALVDLAVHPFAPLLDGEHHHQPYAHPDQGDQGQAQQGGEQALP